MKDNKLTIQIDKPVTEVFEFTTNPKNTHLWVDSISVEETNESPVKVGTIYRNKGSEGDWSEYEVTEFEQDKVFTLSDSGSSYSVRYTYKPLTDTSCEMEYFEWVEEGELDSPFEMTVLETLKKLLEDN